MILADLDHTDHAPPVSLAPEPRPAPRLTLVHALAPVARTLTAAEALALVMGPLPLVVALHVLLHPALLTAWWGVVRHGAALFVRLDDGRGVPTAGPAELNTAALVDLVAADAPELVTELRPEELAHRTEAHRHDVRPWVVLEGVALDQPGGGRFLTNREQLHRLMAAGAGLGTATAARRARGSSAPTSRSSAARRPDLRRADAVVDGGDWTALLTGSSTGRARRDRDPLRPRHPHHARTDAHDRRPSRSRGVAVTDIGNSPETGDPAAT
jgi:hypothetical protein